jgi:hypothetical protein
MFCAAEQGKAGSQSIEPTSHPDHNERRTFTMAENIIPLRARSPYLDENVEPKMLMLQANSVMLVAFRQAEHRANQYWGLKLLIERVCDDVEAARESSSDEAQEKASNSLQGALSLLTAYNDDEVDDELLYAVGTLLSLAKAKVDAAEVLHG